MNEWMNEWVNEFGGEMVENTENIAVQSFQIFYIFVYARKKLPFLPRKYIWSLALCHYLSLLHVTLQTILDNLSNFLGSF